MTRANIYCYTPHGAAPPYLSINHEEDGRTTFAVRGVEMDGNHLGQTGVMTLSEDEIVKLIHQLQKHIAKLREAKS